LECGEARVFVEVELTFVISNVGLKNLKVDSAAQIAGAQLRHWNKVAPKFMAA
jgi:hypothetical protein